MKKIALTRGIGIAVKAHVRKRKAAAEKAGLEAPEAAPGLKLWNTYESMYQIFAYLFAIYVT